MGGPSKKFGTNLDFAGDETQNILTYEYMPRFGVKW